MKITRRKFILYYGIVASIPVGVAWVVTMAVFFHDPTIGVLHYALVYSTVLPFFVVGGYFWGSHMWKWMERRSDRSAARQDTLSRPDNH